MRPPMEIGQRYPSRRGTQGEVLRISSERDDRRIFGGFEIFNFGIFVGWKILASIFLGSLSQAGIYSGIKKREKDSR